MGTAMCIECASNPVCRVHMKSDAHHVQSTLGGGLEVDSNWIALLFMIHARLCLPWDFWLACWLGLWHVLYRFYSCSNVGEERGLFYDG